MPPTRRRAANAAPSRRTQSTLSFGTKSRVTKPSTEPASTTKKSKALEQQPLPVSSITPEEESSIDDVEREQVQGQVPAEEPHISELVVREQAKAEIQKPSSLLSEEEKRASRITEQDLERYWRGEEEKRRAPRVHQENLTLDEKILRHFDLSSQYGPCIGIARLKRWRRADMLNLNPPIEVLAVLLRDQGDTKQRAYVDELMS